MRHSPRQARRAGDAALLLAASRDAPGLAAAITTAALPGVIDVIPARSTVLVRVAPGSWDLARLGSVISALPVAGPPGSRQLPAELPVVYDGPDLADVAGLTGLSAAEVAARHAGAEYTVGWLGFSPGFGYLTGLDPALAAVPRLSTPRTSVPAGSVAIAGGFAAVYPATSPGGWRLIGRTSALLWDPSREPPASLAPGMRVRFRPVRPADLPDPEPPSPAAPSPAATGPAAPGASSLIVIRPGPLATVQDLGRPGYGALGVPPSGAADTASLRLANRLAGNPDDAAGLELTLGRAVLRCAGAARLALTGAPARITAARSAAEIAFGAAFDLADGDVVSIGSPAAGLRSYLAVRGGIDTPRVLGSRSADLLSGLGGGALRPGDVLPVGTPGPAVRARLTAGPPAPLSGVTERLRILPGPRLDWFGADALAVLCASRYIVSAASNRTGLRLDGPALLLARPGAELPSEGVVTGALQVPHDGKPILLLPDHPTTGGYPVIAVVRDADLGLAGQLRPGSAIRFILSR